MAHSDGTQTTSEDMPTPDSLVRRGAVYYFRKRYPAHLLKAGVAPRKEIKKSLGTTNLAEAKRLNSFELAEFHREVEALERKHGLNAGGELHGRANEAGSGIPLSSLSRREQRNLVLRCFVDMEAQAQRERDEYRESHDPEWRKERLWTAREDLTALEGTGPFTPVNWPSYLQQFAENRGVLFDPNNPDEEIVSFFKKAVIESHWRTVESLEGREYAVRDPAFRDLHAATELEATKTDRMSVAKLCEEYLQSKQAAGRAPKTLQKYNNSFSVLKGAVGEQTAVDSLASYEVGKEIVSFLARVPPNATVTYPGCTLAEASRLESAKANPKFIEPKTQRDLFTDIKAILNFAVRHDWISRNPLHGLEDYLPTQESPPRELLTGGDLTTLLQSDDFLRERNRIKKGSRAESRFWCVVLSLFHGMRLNEVASLLVSDIREEKGIHFFDFREFDDQGKPVKRLKGKWSRRRVPVHEEAVRIGFLDFVEYRRNEGGSDWLFSELKTNSFENRGDSISKWFSRLRDKHLGKPNRRGGKSFHTLRHLVADAIREVTESDNILNEIGGWKSASGENSSRRYGKGDLKRLKRVVDQISHEGFDPSFLHLE